VTPKSQSHSKIVAEYSSVRSPREGEWIRTNPDPLYCQEVVMGRIKDGTEHIIAPEIVDQVVALAIKNGYGDCIRRCMAFCVCGRTGDLSTNDNDDHFVWLVTQPVPETHIAYRAMKDWVCFHNLQ
jgi:hypothetical protein